MTVLGGGGTLLYKLYRCVLPQRVWFLSCFGLKKGIDKFLTIMVLNRVWFSREPREHINVFVFSTLNE